MRSNGASTAFEINELPMALTNRRRRRGGQGVRRGGAAAMFIIGADDTVVYAGGTGDKHRSPNRNNPSREIKDKGCLGTLRLSCCQGLT
jgi:hypothetical protein